ncbi:2-amino-4-hydroxy-6-hydroxymethyldihydropteridine diphosphokinase [Marivivens sp. LCG002]|uniref:2-amino-4-hydroxy-6- hydroxymethyldihydropteridine diphosphokinase n=1 Tax=Marivivens sp. LCG002 TaxID=3051171 RepID=UPI002555912C|nr:2-amino-4-hydroxy-6-hydroxymethyldihydropteridine diphosphokinase [Marivivens sp. LCG002]WIV51035.1 2-amino-4-hydroxy-6-hydroxymethyldihydropteridine diphosphokinase [Marivivens sp. LCG002]
MERKQTGRKTLISYIALGSNAVTMDESSTSILQKAISAISERLCFVDVTSSFYQTPCFPAGAGPDYVNAVIAVRSDLEPRDLLTGLHLIEADFGRVREVRWGQRTLDLDLVATEGCVLPDVETVRTWIDLPMERQMSEAPSELLLPHPRLQDRAFVLVPWAEIAPDWRHPILGLTVTEMLDALSESEKAEIRAI